jgi:hypothetical protein
MNKLKILIVTIVITSFVNWTISSQKDEHPNFVYLLDSNDVILDSFIVDNYGNASFQLDKSGIYLLSNQSKNGSWKKKVLLSSGRNYLKIAAPPNYKRPFYQREDALMERVKDSRPIPTSVGKAPILDMISMKVDDAPTRHTDIKRSIAPDMMMEKEKNAKSGVMTAGRWSDLENWERYIKTYKDNSAIRGNWASNLEGKRISVELRYGNSSVASGIPLRILSADGKIVWQNTTDNRGQCDFWVEPFKKSEISKKAKYQLQYKSPSSVESSTWIDLGKVSRGMGAELFSINKKPITPAKAVDIAFIVDATGSMGDEINYLKKELMDVMINAQSMLPCAKIRLGTVFYRDKGDRYTSKSSPFTYRVEDAIEFIQDQQAGGGGDYPEAVDAGISDGLYRLNWSPQAHAKLAFLILDAPPHDEKKSEIEKLSKEYAQKGIKIIPIAASGINKPTEFLLKQLAILTGGEYIYITDDSGVGNSHIKPSGVKSNVDLLKNHLKEVIIKYASNPKCESNEQQNTPDPRTIIFGDDQILVQSFPNPAFDYIDIHSNISINKVSIFSISGKLMKEWDDIKKDRMRFDIREIKQGLYVLKVQTPQKTYSSKTLILDGQTPN